MSTTSPLHTFVDADRPNAADGIETAVFDGEAVLFDVKAQMVHRLSAVAAATWLLCDGQTPVAEMLTELAEIFDQQPEMLRNHLRDALGLLAGEGLLRGYERPPRLTLVPLEELASDASRVISPPPDT